jgi:hypothetical protein
MVASCGRSFVSDKVLFDGLVLGMELLKSGVPYTGKAAFFKPFLG